MIVMSHDMVASWGVENAQNGRKFLKSVRGLRASLHTGSDHLGFRCLRSGATFCCFWVWKGRSSSSGGHRAPKHLFATYAKHFGHLSYRATADSEKY